MRKFIDIYFRKGENYDISSQYLSNREEYGEGRQKIVMIIQDVNNLTFWRCHRVWFNYDSESL